MSYLVTPYSYVHIFFHYNTFSRLTTLTCNTKYETHYHTPGFPDVENNYINLKVRMLNLPDLSNKYKLTNLHCCLAELFLPHPVISRNKLLEK